MKRIDSLPRSGTIQMYKVKTTDDLEVMKYYIRTHMRCNYSYIKGINVDRLFDVLDRPIVEDDIQSHYYINHINGYYTLYYRMIINANSLEDHIRNILYRKYVDLKLGSSFKECEYYFDTEEDAEDYIYNTFDTTNIEVIVRFCCIFYTNVKYGSSTYIFTTSLYLNSIRVLYFNTDVWDIDAIYNLF